MLRGYVVSLRNEVGVDAFMGRREREAILFPCVSCDGDSSRALYRLFVKV